jgi:hypothetical protein
MTTRASLLARDQDHALFGFYFVTEPLTGGLPRNAKGSGNPVPAPPVRPRARYPLGEQRLVSPGLLSGLGHGPQVG